MISRIAKPKIQLLVRRDVSREELLYSMGVMLFLIAWTIIALSSWIFISLSNSAEWIRIGTAVVIVGSQFSILYVFGIVIPSHIWRKNK